jgi:hypothetical protein
MLALAIGVTATFLILACQQTVAFRDNKMPDIRPGRQEDNDSGFRPDSHSQPVQEQEWVKTSTGTVSSKADFDINDVWRVRLYV